jgi:hypothetical protein
VASTAVRWAANVLEDVLSEGGCRGARFSPEQTLLTAESSSTSLDENRARREEAAELLCAQVLVSSDLKNLRAKKFCGLFSPCSIFVKARRGGFSRFTGLGNGRALTKIEQGEKRPQNFFARKFSSHRI